MGFKPDVLVGAQKLSDGPQTNFSPRYDPDGGQVVVENHGKYWEQLIRGNVSFAGTAAAGATVVASASAAVGILYWNQGVGAAFDEIARLETGYISGANVPGFFAWYYLKGGANIGTAAPIATLVTAGTIVNGLLGGSPIKTPGYVCYIGASTWTGFAYLKATRMSMLTGVAATAVAPFMLWEEYDGTLGIQPLFALQLNHNAANTAVMSYSATIVENLWTSPVG